MKVLTKVWEQFFTTQTFGISLWGFILDLILVVILSSILMKIYIRYGESLSNRKKFANNFSLMSMTTMFIILIIKSSLTLSLGLVGALSIVRFRAAIKEPEELSYLFLAIGIGLGLGSGHRELTVLFLFAIAIFIVLRSYFSNRDIEQNRNLYLTVSNNSSNKVTIKQIMEVLKNNCSKVSMKRYDKKKELLEAAFLIEFDNFEQLSILEDGLRDLNNDIKVSFLDNKGIL